MLFLLVEQHRSKRGILIKRTLDHLDHSVFPASYLVRLVKEQLGMHTLAIGDGANDVSMIQVLNQLIPYITITTMMII